MFTIIGLAVQVVRIGTMLVRYDETLYQPTAATFAENIINRSIARLKGTLTK